MPEIAKNTPQNACLTSAIGPSESEIPTIHFANSGLTFFRGKNDLDERREFMLSAAKSASKEIARALFSVSFLFFSGRRVIVCLGIGDAPLIAVLNAPLYLETGDAPLIAVLNAFSSFFFLPQFWLLMNGFHATCKSPRMRC